MRILPAAIMSVGILVFTIGIGMFIVYFSETKSLEYVGTESATERRDSLNGKAMQGFYLMGIGGGVAMFIIVIDEDRRSKERELEKGFFF